VGPAGKPISKAVLYGGGGAAVVVLLGLGLLIGRAVGGDAPAADGSAKAGASAEPEKESDADEKKAAKKDGADEKKDEKAEPRASASASASAGPEATAKPQSGSTTSSGSSKSTGSSKSSGSASKSSDSKADSDTMPSSGAGPFRVSAAQVALTQAAANAGSCAKPGGPTGAGKAQVTFATSGRVTSANVTSGPFVGNAVGGCVASVFRRARVPAFSGNPVTVSKSFMIK
jgi:hypothetical protein